MTAPSPGRINITAGHVARHTPRSAGAQGRDAALIDIAQDLLLRELHQQGLLDDLVFKGGTALRKLYAGNQGRFSLDLDFSVATIGVDPDDILELLGLHVEGLQLGPFRYAIAERRGKRHLQMSSTEFGGSDSLVSKLDVSPPPWLRPQRRGWVPMPVHATYGDPPLPHLPVVRLEENIAEKIARLNRTTPARDMYDLRWVNDTFLRAGHLDTALVRRLAVLKIWVDNFGLIATTPHGQVEWKPGHEGSVFDVDRWLRHRSSDEFDIEDIGALAIPPPTLPDLAAAVADGYQFLATVTDDEQQLAHCRGQDRQLALRLLRELPDNNSLTALCAEHAHARTRVVGTPRGRFSNNRPVRPLPSMNGWMHSKRLWISASCIGMSRPVMAPARTSVPKAFASSTQVVSCAATSGQDGGAMPPGNGRMSCSRRLPGASRSVASGWGLTDHTDRTLVGELRAPR